MWPMTTPRGCASGSVGALCTRAALAASGGMRIGSWIMAPIATSHSRTTVAALMLWIAAAAVGRAGARPPIFRRRGPPEASIPGEPEASGDGAGWSAVLMAAGFRAGRPSAGQGRYGADGAASRRRCAWRARTGAAGPRGAGMP